MVDGFGFPDLNGLIEVLCLTVMFYYVLFFFRGTRGAPVLAGFVLVFVVLIGVTRLFRLDALNWLLGRFSVYLAAAFLIIFQPEIRRALAELGKQHMFGGRRARETLVDEIVQAVFLLASRRIGALIAVERAIGTRATQESGISVDSMVSAELLASVFFPYTPLHDGGVIIANNRIVAARCLFPLTQQTELSKSLGTRHRAAVGFSEETDAVVVVVSEERGMVSVAYEGRLLQNLDEHRLRRFLADILLKPRPSRRFRDTLRDWLRSLRRNP